MFRGFLPLEGGLRDLGGQGLAPGWWSVKPFFPSSRKSSKSAPAPSAASELAVLGTCQVATCRLVAAGSLFCRGRTPRLTNPPNAPVSAPPRRFCLSCSLTLASSPDPLTVWLLLMASGQTGVPLTSPVPSPKSPSSPRNGGNGS